MLNEQIVTGAEAAKYLDCPLEEKNERNIIRKYFYYGIKRLLDIVLGLAALIVLSPLFLVLAFCIYADDKGPVIYRHERLGRYGKKIGIWKFRSMYQNADEIFKQMSSQQKEEFYRDFKMADDPRITRIGRLLRKSSLDELPQLVNIIKGELSIVGPRPIVEEELSKYDNQAERFLSVKPGLTGYWQANGRNEINYENGRKEMELYYIEHQSIWLDIKIVVKTVGAVVRGKGAR